MTHVPHGAPVAHQQSRVTIRSLGAMSLAGLFLAGTAFVLFQDIYEGAPLNTSHVLTLLALTAATAAGHSCLPVWREGRRAVATGLAVLTLAGLGYIVTMSGARNAETVSAKAVTITASNGERKAIEDEIATTKGDLKTQDAAAAAECASGVGKKCDGKRTTADRTRSHLALLEAKFALTKPATVANAGYKHLAKLWVKALGGSEAAVEEAFVLYMPFVAVLITELGTIVFLGMALGHRTVTRTHTAPAPTAHSFPNPDDLPPGDVDDARRVLNPSPRAANSNVVDHPVLAAVRKAGRPLTNDELAEAMGVTKGEASKRRREVADRLVEQRDGRFLRIAAR